MHGMCLQPAQEGSESEEKLNISTYIADFSQLTNVYETKAQMSSEDILDVVRLLENVTPNELLRNATQQNRDLFAKVHRFRKGHWYVTTKCRHLIAIWWNKNEIAIFENKTVLGSERGGLRLVFTTGVGVVVVVIIKLRRAIPSGENQTRFCLWPRRLWSSENYNLGVTGVGKIHFIRILPLPTLSSVDKTLQSNTSLHFTIFQHWRRE